MAELDAQDIEWIEKCLKNDQVAFERLYQKYSPWLYSVCLRYVSNKDDAQDILQDSFILIYNNLKQYSKEASFRGWMKKITVNCALGSFRKKNAAVYTNSKGDAEEQIVIDLDFVNDMDVEELHYFIDKLAPGRKQVFNAYVIEGFSHKEIAQQLGIAEGTSKSQLFDAKRELKLAIDNKFAIAKTKDL